MNWFQSFWKALTVPPTAGSPGSQEPPTNFTPRAQQALALARREAERLHHNFVGTEHLLLGLISLGQGTGVAVLRRFGVELETARREVEKDVGPGPDQNIIGHIPYTPRVRKVLALAAKEAQALNHTYVGTEHILLGLLLEGDGVAARVLKSLGVDAKRARVEILKELDPNAPGTFLDTGTSESPQPSRIPESSLAPIDTTLRYDVYSAERKPEIVVYRNALFKRRRKLLSTQPWDLGSEFLELELANGQTVCLSAVSVIKFCPPGAEISGEIIPPP